MIIGIDLGTTNCAVAVWRNGAVEMIPNSLGHHLTPSAISVDDNGEVIAGLPARERQATHPGQTATAFKRYMGTQRTTRLGAKGYLPEELSALLLQKLKSDAEAYLGKPVREAVITVPAYFNDKQRKATRRAGELAGLNVERLLNEPTAAALAYGIHQRDRQSRFLVFDLGGGTFDVSVLEIFEGVIEVRASTGDNRLGGEDFNELLVARMAGHFAKAWPDPRENNRLLQRLRVAAERARRALSTKAATTMAVVWEDQPYKLEVTADWFEQAAEPLIARLREPVLRSLRDSELHPSALDEIVLVGGATRMPVVRKAVTKMFGRFPAASINPDEAIAAGAAVQAGLKARDEALSEVVVTDVCPYTLGVETGEIGPGSAIRKGLFSPIIERNTTIPASRMHTFSTLRDGQREVEFNIYQGEARWVVDNIKLGRIVAPVPPKNAGEVSVECRFSYDINGLLEVDIHVPETGKKRQLVILDSDDVAPAELEKRRATLAALKVHPREADANRAAIARAARCYEDFIGEHRDYIAALISRFETVMDQQYPRAVDAARAELMAALDGIEGPTFL